MTNRDPVVGDHREPRAPIATRADPPKPRQLSRKALALLVGVGALGVAGAFGYSLTTRHHSQAPQETVSVDRSQKPETLADAPRDYGDLARSASAGIGPPPKADAPTATTPAIGVAPSPPTQANRAISAEEQRRRQQRDSARSAKLFAGTSQAPGNSDFVAADSSSPPSRPSTTVPAAIGSADRQDHKPAFVAGGATSPTTNSGRLTPPAGRYVISAGSTIAAALITGLSSDLPGQVVAQVTENVFDTVTGRALLIPQGARLIGEYDADQSYGQTRASVLWIRLILPDGRSITLDRMIGTDASGRSGLTDRVDHHTGKLIRAGLLSSLFGIGTNLAVAGGDNDAIAFAIRDSAGQSIERAGDKLVGRQLDVQPTITVRPGARVRVLVSRDLVLTPWPTGAH